MTGSRKMVEVGQFWTVKLYGMLTVVRITNIRMAFNGRRTMWRADASNMRTDRHIIIKSATKLRALIPPCEAMNTFCASYCAKRTAPAATNCGRVERVRNAANAAPDDAA